MKKILSILSLALTLALFATVANADVIVSVDDFDGSAAGVVALSANNSISATIVADPLDATNMVAAIDLEPGGQWGAYSGVNAGVDIAALGLAAGDSLDWSFDVLVPSGTTVEAGDAAALIVRWGEADNVPNPGNTGSGANAFDAMTPDAWTTISGSFVIPAANALGGVDPVTHFNPIWSFRDFGDDAAVGVTAYVDNFSITSPVAVPEPTSLAILGLLGGVVAIRRRR